MSHKIQNTSIFNSSNEIKKINERDVARTPANILDGTLCNNSERLEITIFTKLFILDVCGMVTTPQNKKLTRNK